jgi:hypothetical protein
MLRLIAALCAATMIGAACGSGDETRPFSATPSAQEQIPSASPQKQRPSKTPEQQLSESPQPEPTAPGPPPTQSAVLVGAGDIAYCDSSQDEATAALLDGIEGTVYTLGDNVYEDGTSSEFAQCYEGSWGRHKGRTKPSAGNHEYKTDGAAGYFDYFAEAAGERGKGYYSYELGGWHIVVLNSNCKKVACDAGSAQAAWLRADLQASDTRCTLAYWHHPRFSSGDHGDHAEVSAFWEDLYADGADVVLASHDHDYERFAPQNPNGGLDLEHGIRQFVVGTGGKSLDPFASTQDNSEVRNNQSYGVLKLTLLADSYAWEFIPASGDFRDSGQQACH